jgi:ribosomal protein L7/L12
MSQLTDNEKSVVIDAIALVRSLTKAYGPEEGSKFWDAIASTARPQLKNAVFLAMLTGEYEDNVTFRVRPGHTQKIASIKAIRHYTGMGLTESKEAYEKSEFSPVTIRVQPEQRKSCVMELRSYGMEAH